MEEMKRIKLTVAYDGTDYCGWQVQNNGPTIEGELNKVLSRVTGTPVKVIGASRTDAGVHAKGNVAVFDTESRIPPERFMYVLNSFLPPDVVVTNSCRVAGDWHPRHCDSEKTYEYRVLNREVPDPLHRRDAYFVSYPLNLPNMRRAAAALTGTHDFKSFCCAQSEAENTVRTLYELDIRKDGELLVFTARGSGFLYNMVRILVGTLLEVGRGKRKPEDMPAILEKKDRQAAGMTAPPQGLTLVEIRYDVSPEA